MCWGNSEPIVNVWENKSSLAEDSLDINGGGYHHKFLSVYSNILEGKETYQE